MDRNTIERLALREIDELPLETIQKRIDALQSREKPEKWMIAMSAFHQAMREVLAIKRVIGRRKITPALRRAVALHVDGRRRD